MGWLAGDDASTGLCSLVLWLGIPSPGCICGCMKRQKDSYSYINAGDEAQSKRGTLPGANVIIPQRRVSLEHPKISIGGKIGELGPGLQGFKKRREATENKASVSHVAIGCQILFLANLRSLSTISMYVRLQVNHAYAYYMKMQLQ